MYKKVYKKCTKWFCYLLVFVAVLTVFYSLPLSFPPLLSSHYAPTIICLRFLWLYVGFVAALSLHSKLKTLQCAVSYVLLTRSKHTVSTRSAHCQHQVTVTHSARSARVHGVVSTRVACCQHAVSTHWLGCGHGRGPCPGSVALKHT